MRIKELQSVLSYRNYPINVVENGIEIAMKIKKKELRIEREK